MRFFFPWPRKKKKKKRLKAGKLPRQTRNNNVIGLQDKRKNSLGSFQFLLKIST